MAKAIKKPKPATLDDDGPGGNPGQPPPTPPPTGPGGPGSPKP